MDDAPAFAAFYRDNHGPVLAAVRATVGEASLAREAVDEAFVRAAERWPTVAAARQPAAWTYRVAVNWATSWRRKLAIRPTRPASELDREHLDVLPDPDLVDLLATLPLDQRQTLVLRFAFDLSVRETAAVLGVAEGTVKSSVHRAKQQLRDGLLPVDDEGHHDRDRDDQVRGDREVLDGRP